MKERPILFKAEMVRAILEGCKTQTRRIAKVPEDAERVSYWAPPSGRSQLGWADPGVNWWNERGNHLDPCPYGQIGDQLWVRETCRAEELQYAGWEDGVRYLADNAWRVIENTSEAADKWHDLASYGMKKSGLPECRTVPAIHMPRWASRIQLEITGVRVERLQDISEADAMAEGVAREWTSEKDDIGLNCSGFSFLDYHGDPEIDFTQGTARDSYRTLWNSINLPPTPILEEKKVVGYVSFPWSNADFDDAFPGVRELGVYRGKPIAVTENPWVWCVDFRRIGA
ncbi:MAG: hypothetical protein KGL39_50390 [Patescibacteria group bacterium]|nr:hypothetical protein [Patescibacteria group bacterium]